MSVATSHITENAVGVAVKAPRRDEGCERIDCPSPPAVATELMSGRLTWCGHHYDELPESFRKAILGFYDLRPEWQAAQA
jgi:hypothetical protein